MPISSVTEHWIKPDAVTINLNHFGDPDYLQVSVLAGAVVMAFKKGVISYNAAHNYRTWPLQAANTYLETTSAYHVYARLTRSEVNASALIIYDPVLRDIEGREITYAHNEGTGEETEVLGEPDIHYFFIYLGTISTSLNEQGHSTERTWENNFKFGSLDTSQQINESFGIEKLFVAHYDDPLNPKKLSWIEVLANMGVRGGITFYARGEDVDIPTIAEGLPFDGTTIRFNKDTGQIEVIGGTGGGGSADFSNVFSSGKGNAFTSFTLSKDKKTLTFFKDKTFAEKASSLAGYGITDAYTKSNVDSLLKGYITEITSGMVINALGYTPYASSNPNGYITKSALSGYAEQTWVKNQGYLTQHQDLSGYQPLITSTNKLAYSLISGTPTSLKNPNSLSFGSKNYDGSSAKTITASDLGALTSHQTIYKLTFQGGTFSSTSFTANDAEKTIKIPTSADHITDGVTNKFFTKQQAIDALAETLKNYVNLSDNQEIEGVKTFKNGLKGTNWVIGSDSYGNPYVKFYNDWYVKCTNSTMVVGKNNAQLVINQYGHIEVAGGATINGNMLVKGGVSFYSTNGSATPFLLDADKVEDIDSESKTQVYTANAVRLLKEELAEAKAKADACETELANLKEKIKTALSGISSSSTASAIGSALKKLYDNI